MPPHSSSTSHAVNEGWQKETRRFIESGGNTTHAFGLGRLIGRIYALLYISPHPISLEDVASRLSISKASASIAIRQLALWKAVQRRHLSGDRRDFYEVETDFRRILREGLLPGLRKKIDSAGTQVNRMTVPSIHSSAQSPSKDVPGYNPAEWKVIQKRLRAAQSLHRKLDAILGSSLIEKLL